MVTDLHKFNIVHGLKLALYFDDLINNIVTIAKSCLKSNSYCDGGT